jgi:crotonobetainyl-CoA:carnitine CoA-transferase CaiB-like acyl-CoA transferase
VKVQNNQPLGDIRVLDLTNARGLLCGKILADLGADVIKIEAPGGDEARNVGPFYHDIPDHNKSLYWFAYNTNKRSVTLDIGKTQGQQLLKRMVKTADILIESFDPGYLDKLGLGCDDLSKVNPGIIFTSITPFGQNGPYKEFKGSDIAVWALSGLMNITGNPDRPPVQVSLPQSFIAASTHAAEATMVALYARDQFGEGQHVDVSAMECLSWTASEAFPFWFALHENKRRTGDKLSRSEGANPQQIWPCKDGYVSYIIQVGLPGAERNTKMAKWLGEEGLASDFIRDTDWYQLDWVVLVKGGLDRLISPISKLFERYKVKELLDQGLKRGISIYPIANSKDTVENEQLAFRKFWVSVDHPELAARITYPGPFVALSATPIPVPRRAPLIGEHNEEIYVKELGLSHNDLKSLIEHGIV